jgi:hypothetical protein
MVTNTQPRDLAIASIGESKPMAEVKQSKPTNAKINEKLGNHASGRSPQANITTHPTRTVTNVYHSGFQAQKGDEVKTGAGLDGDTSWPLK